MDALRLAFGLLTAVPVPPPRVVDRRVAGWALTLAPLVGALLGLVVAGLLALPGPPLLLAALAVAALALLTRGLHLDGLADTADGLGSGRPADGALEVMRRSDIGPFGVVTLVVVVLIDVTALAAVPPWTAAAAVLTSRFVLPVLGGHAFPAARPGGLGAVVAGSVRPWQGLLALLVTALACVATSPYLLLGPVAGLLLALHCRRRLGGVTGDVYGACVEITLAASLVAVALTT